ncbi:hypothetical protein Bca101_018600 [Brassica carinata]
MIKNYSRKPPISHLLFADDNLFFCKADVLQFAELMNIINNYGQSLGQQLNVAKSSILFGRNVPQDFKTNIKKACELQKEEEC